MIAGTTLDEFLTGRDNSAADRLRDVGAALGMFGILTVVGLLALLATAHTGPRRELVSLIRLARVAGAVTACGAVAELLGITRRLGVDLLDALDVEGTSAAMLRLIGGALIALGLFDEVQELAPPGDRYRWLPGAGSSFGIVGAALGALSFAFDGHQLTEGPRALHASANVVHVIAGGVWFGGVVGLLVAAFLRHRSGSDQPIAPIVVRFSSIATLAVFVVAVVGVSMTVTIMDEFDDLTGSEWGRRLILKVVAVAVVSAVGAYNHFVVVPRLRRHPDDRSATHNVHTTLAVEALFLAFVIAVTAVLVNSSTV